MKINFKLLITLLTLSISAPLWAEPTADKILTQVRDRDDGYSYITDVKLKLISSKNTVRERSMHMLQKDMANKEERAAMYFYAPADVRDVGFLVSNHAEHTGKASDQWMYFPAFRKIRRIGSNDKRGSFMGSTFAYVDLDKVNVSDYNSTLTGEEKLLGRMTWVIERIPASQDVINKTGYHKTKVWVDKKRHIILQQQYFNAKDILFKQQQSVEVEKIQDIWTIMRSVMNNVELNKSSEMIFSKVKYNVELDDKNLSQRNLKKGLRASVIELSK